MVELANRSADAAHQALITWSADLTTRSGYAFHVRPAAPDDEAALAEFFTHADKEDLRFRFLTAIQKVGHEQLRALVTNDDDRTDNLLAIEARTGLILAIAMIAADKTRRNPELSRYAPILKAGASAGRCSTMSRASLARRA